MASAVKKILREITMGISLRIKRSGMPERCNAGAFRGVGRLLEAIGAAIASLVCVSAMAQQAPAASSSENPELQEIVVTGSMIKRINVETAEAITVVKMDTLKDLGVISVEQALSLITSNNATITTASNVTTFNGGASVASLRGIGPTKTLVLLDGQRLANNVALGSGVDLNTIPFAAIDHIEVLREGASSLYGSDAIAGVINFITKKDYSGGEVNLNYSHPEHPGGSSDNADLAYGIGNLASDGYNLMITGNYTQQKELTASQRSFAATGYNQQLGLNDNLNGPTGPWPGSYTDIYPITNSKTGITTETPSNLWQTGYPTCEGNPHLVRLTGSCQYAYSAAVDLLPQQSTESGLISFTTTLPANNTLTIQYFLARSNLETWGGPQEYSFYMQPSSPYYPTAAHSTCINGPGGSGPCINPNTGAPSGPNLSNPTGIIAGWTDPNNNRYFGNINTEQRALGTLAGSNFGWDYATSFDWSQNKGTQQVRGGEANYNLLAPGGVLSNLINPFGPQSAAGQALINSAYMNGNLEVGKMTFYDLNGHAGHPLGDLFDAGRPAQFAFGFDYKDEEISNVPTPLATTLYSATYFPVNLVTGSRVSEAAYVELNVPMSKDAEFTVSDRQDRYSDFGTTNNAKASFAYTPINMLKIRGAASTGFRAPTLVEEYSPNVFGASPGASTMGGPGCAAHDYNAVFSQQNCTSQGLSLTGGNQNLKPETSQNFSLGFVVQPLSNLDVTVDYYRINLRNEIQALPGVTIYGNPTTFADLYVLNSAGTLTPAPYSNIECPAPAGHLAPTCGYIIQTNQNTGSIVTDGFDVSSNYVINSDFGKFRIGMEGTFVTGYRFTEYPGGPQLNLVGQFNQGNQPVVRWQHELTFDWAYQNFGAGLNNHFIEHYVDANLDAAQNPITVGNYSLWNGYVSFRPIPALKLLAGINNLADTNPPFSNQNLNWQAGYNPIFSSPLGRTFYGRITFDF
jgi:iron complex outermembrane recepter protein